VGEELIVLLVVPAVGYVTRKVTQKGVAALRARGVKVPTWIERGAPAMISTVAGAGTAVGLPGALPGKP